MVTRNRLHSNAELPGRTSGRNADTGLQQCSPGFSQELSTNLKLSERFRVPSRIKTLLNSVFPEACSSVRITLQLLSSVSGILFSSRNHTLKPRKSLSPQLFNLVPRVHWTLPVLIRLSYLAVQAEPFHPPPSTGERGTTHRSFRP